MLLSGSVSPTAHMQRKLLSHIPTQRFDQFLGARISSCPILSQFKVNTCRRRQASGSTCRSSMLEADVATVITAIHATKTKAVVYATGGAVQVRKCMCSCSSWSVLHAHVLDPRGIRAPAQMQGTHKLQLCMHQMMNCLHVCLDVPSYLSWSTQT